jgi:hypothetical protein
MLHYCELYSFMWQSFMELQVLYTLILTIHCTRDCETGTEYTDVQQDAKIQYYSQEGLSSMEIDS